MQYVKAMCSNNKKAVVRIFKLPA